jgi:hypothetical protein
VDTAPIPVAGSLLRRFPRGPYEGRGEGSESGGRTHQFQDVGGTRDGLRRRRAPGGLVRSTPTQASSKLPDPVETRGSGHSRVRRAIQRPTRAGRISLDGTTDTHRDGSYTREATRENQRALTGSRARRRSCGVGPERTSTSTAGPKPCPERSASMSDVRNPPRSSSRVHRLAVGRSVHSASGGDGSDIQSCTRWDGPPQVESAWGIER